jgi:hypothetical protein
MPQFLAALVLLIVSYPFLIELTYGEFIENCLLVVLFVFAALAVSGRAKILTFILAVPAIAGQWLRTHEGGLVPVWLITSTHSIFVAFVIFQLLRFILRANHVNTEVMCAGITGYLMLGLFWTPTILMVSQLHPDSFTSLHWAQNEIMGRFDALYLSFVTLTCLGCNDITPVSKIARMLLMVESLTGVLYLAVMIARLVALYSHSVQNQPSSKHN